MSKNISFTTIPPTVELADHDQGKVLARKLEAVLAAEWRPSKPSSAANWDQGPMTKSRIARAAGYGGNVLYLGEIDPPDMRGFVKP